MVYAQLSGQIATGWGLGTTICRARENGKKTIARKTGGPARKADLASPAGLEPATLCLEGRCSIHLSYGLYLNCTKHRKIEIQVFFTSALPAPARAAEA